MKSHTGHVLLFSSVVVGIAIIVLPLITLDTPVVENREIRSRLSHTTTVDITLHKRNHSYFRPSDYQVSAFPSNDAPYHRSPCPGLNTLANHGYLPRDGKNLTPNMIKQALMEVFNLDDSLAQPLVGMLPPALTLADLSVHNYIEHDASLVHDDLHFGQDPSQVNSTLANDVLSRATDQGTLTVMQMAQVRRVREAQSTVTNPRFSLSFKHTAASYVEAAAFLAAMGDYDSESILVEDARFFLQDERFPDQFERSPVTITIMKALLVAAKVKILSIVPWEMLTDR